MKKLPPQLNLFEETKFSPTAAEFTAAVKEEFVRAKPQKNAKAKKRRNRGDSIYLPEDMRAYQESFLIQDHVRPYPDGVFPPIEKTREAVVKIIEEADFGDWIGLDFEFNPTNHRISIIGVANVERAAACRWDRDFIQLLFDAYWRSVKLVGHWVLGADKYELEWAAKLEGYPWETGREGWVDSLGLHYITMAGLCKAPGKESDDDTALGYMGISSALAVHTDIPSGYKECRGVGCFGPCPKHSIFDYCAVDAFGGLRISLNARELMRERSIPWAAYEKWAKLTDKFALVTERRGILVDKPFVDNFEKVLQTKKEGLFPKQNGAFDNFNPSSGKQVLHYFHDKGFDLKSNTKKDILATLEKALRSYGVADLKEFESSHDPMIMQEADDLLYKLYLYKDSGKGLKPWFAEDKFLFKADDGNYYIYPRFNTTGTSTTRFSSSRPNFQNISSDGRGWGREVKKAIIPRPGYKFLDCDGKQLELRIVLDNAGVDIRKIEGDAFDWLVANSGGEFRRAADELFKGDERAVAKRINHASSYGEGFRLYDDYLLATDDMRKAVGDGSIRIFPDWTFAGKVVGFTGVNLARTLYGNATVQSRRKALNLQWDVYFKNFKMIHKWHRKITAQVEKGFIQDRFGGYLELLDTPANNFKAAAARIGQGEGSQAVQTKMIDYLDYHPEIPMVAQVHDSIIWEIPIDWSNERILEFVRPLSEEPVRDCPSLVIPFKAKSGPNWGELREVK